MINGRINGNKLLALSGRDGLVQLELTELDVAALNGIRCCDKASVLIIDTQQSVLFLKSNQ